MASAILKNLKRDDYVAEIYASTRSSFLPFVFPIKDSSNMYDHTYIHTGRQAGRQSVNQTDRQTDRHTEIPEIQTYRHAYRQTYIQACINIHTGTYNRISSIHKYTHVYMYLYRLYPVPADQAFWKVAKWRTHLYLIDDVSLPVVSQSLVLSTKIGVSSRKGLRFFKSFDPLAVDNWNPPGAQGVSSANGPWSAKLSGLNSLDDLISHPNRTVQ